MERKSRIILVTGCSGSGKTTIAAELHTSATLRGESAEIISTDDFYKVGEFDNYDVPDVIDSERLLKVIGRLASGKPVKYHKYDFVAHDYSQSAEVAHEPADNIIIEGIFSAYYPELTAIASEIVFVECDLDECLARRIVRDHANRGINPIDTIEKWRNQVKPGYTKYVLPLKTRTDIAEKIRFVNNCNYSLTVIAVTEI